jgi:anti-sigma regulatory factor (Ser/Thr protein kinase)
MGGAAHVSERLRLGLGLDAPARAREWIGGVCKSSGLDHVSGEATLMVSELVTNAVVHARTDCMLVAEHRDQVLRVEVFDLDFSDVRPGSGGPGAETGRGLMIVGALATDWGVTQHPTGKSVWFTLATAGRADTAQAGSGTFVCA